MATNFWNQFHALTLKLKSRGKLLSLRKLIRLLFQSETGPNYYKEVPLSEILAVDSAKTHSGGQFCHISTIDLKAAVKRYKWWPVSTVFILSLKIDLYLKMLSCKFAKEFLRHHQYNSSPSLFASNWSFIIIIILCPLIDGAHWIGEVATHCFEIRTANVDFFVGEDTSVPQVVKMRIKD